MSQAIDFKIPISQEKEFCFISYSREDAPRISEIMAALSKKGLPIWYDKYLSQSKDWEKQIAEKIDNCWFVLAFLSNNSFEKEDSYSIAECRMAKEIYKKTVYYVLLDDIDTSKIRYEYAMWWTKNSSLHHFEVDKKKTAEQTATSIYEVVKSTPKKETDSKKTSSDDFAAVFFPLLLLFGILGFILAASSDPSFQEYFSNDNEKAIYQDTESEIPFLSDSTPASDTEDTITIYGEIQAPASDFIFPYSSTELISEEDMYSVFGSSDPDSMRMKSQAAINEIFARYGYTFTSNKDTGVAAREKFSPLSWYAEVQQICPSSDSEIIQEEYMNDVETENIDRILAWREENGVVY